MEDTCKECGKPLRTRETESSLLLVCTNAECDNYWVRYGAEIVMLLK